MIEIILRDNTNLGDIDMRDILHDGVEAVSAHLIDHLGNYTLYAPAPSPSYTRTGDLGRHWTYQITSTSNAIVGTLGNAVRSRNTGRSYGPYVMDPQEQAAHMAALGWPTTDDIATDQEQPARRLFDAVVNRGIS